MPPAIYRRAIAFPLMWRKIIGHHEPHFWNTRRCDQRACAPGEFSIQPNARTDSPTSSNDDGNRFSTRQVRCLHLVHGQSLRPLHGERPFQHHERELRLQSTERAYMGMCGDRQMQEIDASRRSPEMSITCLCRQDQTVRPFGCASAADQPPVLRFMP